MSLFLCCHFYWCTSCINFVTHLALSLFLLSLSLSFFSVWFFQSLITCPLFSDSYLLCFCHYFYMYSFQWVLCVCQCWCFALPHNSITSFSGEFPPCSLSPICISLFLLPPTLSHLFNMRFCFFSTFICLDRTSPLQLLTSNPSFIEWPLSYDHLSPAPTPLSPPLSFYLARRTSFPPWVLQTPVWKLKVEGEVVEAEEEEEKR